MTAVRKGQAPDRLSRAEFGRRFRASFFAVAAHEQRRLRPDAQAAIAKRSAHARRFIANFMGAVNLLPGIVERVAPMSGEPGVVRVGSGLRLETLLPADATQDGSVTVMIRPEDIAIARAAPERDRNVVPGTITGSSFLGNLVDYVVETGCGVMRIQTPRGVTFDRGEHVHLVVPPERCIGIG